MTELRGDSAPAPLDITYLDLGPPVDSPEKPDTEPLGAADAIVGRALVAFRDSDAVAERHARRVHEDRNAAGIEERTRELPPPGTFGTGPDVRYMTPREMQEYSQDLYAAGIITFDDYEALAFQPDLHPDFNRTIGALTGERAEPDRPRDYIMQWQKRLGFAQRYYPANSNEVRQAHRILSAIRTYPQLGDIFA